MLGRLLIQADDRHLAAAAHRHVPAAGGDIDAAGQDGLAVARLGRRALARPLQLFGQHGGEGRGHVLGQQDRLFQLALQVGEQGHQGGRRAGRSADGQDLGPHGRRQGGGAHDGGRVCGRCCGGGRGCGAAPAASLTQGLDLGGQFAGEFFRADQAAGLGLGHIVGGAGLQGLQADAGVSPRQGGGHDDLHLGPFLQDQGQGGQAVHDRHLDVQNHDVDRRPVQFGQGRLALGGARHDKNAGIMLQQLNDQTAHDGAVVHDHDANAGISNGRRRGFQQGGHPLG